jgi:hypothetical protein
MEVGKVKKTTSCPYGEGIRGVETEKPDTGPTIEFYVEPQVQLRKSREIREIWQGPAHDTLHSERDDSDPGGAVELLNFERWGDKRLQLRGGNRPVGKQQVAPRLPPRPFGIRDCPGTMINSREYRMVQQSSLTPNGLNSRCRRLRHQTAICGFQFTKFWFVVLKIRRFGTAQPCGYRAVGWPQRYA